MLSYREIEQELTRYSLDDFLEFNSSLGNMSDKEGKKALKELKQAVYNFKTLVKEKAAEERDKGNVVSITKLCSSMEETEKTYDRVKKEIERNDYYNVDVALNRELIGISIEFTNTKMINYELINELMNL